MNNENVVIKTNRLIIKNSTLGDAEGFFEILSNPKMAHFVKLITDISQTKKMLEKKIIKYSGNNGIMFSVFESRTMQMIGNINLKIIDKNIASLSYIINPKFWNVGYATESAKAVVNWGFSNFNLNKIVADCNENNLASIKILKDKLNMQLVDIKQNYMFDEYRNKMVAFMFFELNK